MTSRSISWENFLKTLAGNSNHISNQIEYMAGLKFGRACVLLGPLVPSVVLCGLSSITVPSGETSLQMSEPRAQQDCTRAR